MRHFMTANFSIQMKWIISEKNKLNKISTRINNLNSLVSKVIEYINKNIFPPKKLQVCIASPIKFTYLYFKNYVSENTEVIPFQ